MNGYGGEVPDTNGQCVEYSPAIAHIVFVKGYEACRFCPLFETYARKQCRQTGEYIINENTVGYHCPLEFDLQKENV